MAHGNADCTACGHAWELRKPPIEIDVLRCSECGATGETISLTDTPTGTIDPDTLSIVERLEIEEHRIALRIRARRLMDDIEQIGGGLAPEELEPVYMALDTLVAKLTGDELIAPDELDEIAEYLIEKEEAIYTRDDVTKVTDLDRRRESLAEDVETLQNKKR